MTDEERTMVTEYRAQNLGYKKIAQLTGISLSTIKSFCKRKERKKESSTCQQCGKVFIQAKGKKKKKFCSDKCRMTWWNTHRNMVGKKTFRKYICPACRKKFKVYGNVQRKYCSFDCYMDDRFDRKKKRAEEREMACQER